MPSPEHAPRTPRAVTQLAPRALRAALDQLRLDARMVADRLAGRRPAPVIRRGTRAPAATAAPSPFAARAMRVTEVTRETPDAVTLHLASLDGAPTPFLAGQFFTVLVTVEGRALRRAYSASNSALDPTRLALTIKRVPGGAVSNHLNDHARAGDVLELLGPSGSFTASPEPAGARHVVLVGGGSGITPLASIADTVLAREPRSVVSLVYGNRALPDVIFRERLARLAAEHAGRFTVRHVLSEPPPGWTGGVGLLDRAALAAELDALPAAPSELPSEYFVCGPEPMMLEARAALLARGVAPAAIREERFTQPHLRALAATAAASSEPRRLAIHAAGRDHVVLAQPGQTVLEAGLAAGVAMPYSCTMGGCGACKVRVRRGAVEMEEPNCLSAEERAGGYVLACVGRAIEECVVEVG